jgi:hypothetical protein
MTRPPVFLAALLLLAPSACEKGGPPPDETPGPITLPGSLTGPDGSVPDLSGDSLVVVYFWIPLKGCAPADSGLVELASVQDSLISILPIQFTIDDRNYAQACANDLGISLPVYLADSDFASTVPVDVLPVAILYARGAAPVVETGYGCAGRLLGI